MLEDLKGRVKNHLEEHCTTESAGETGDLDDSIVLGEEPKTWEEMMESGNPDKYFSEMAEIYPKYNRDHNPDIQFHVCVVQGGEGPEPHVHVYLGKKGDNSKGQISYVCLASAEYAPQHTDGVKLNAKQKKALITYFETMRKGAFTTGPDGNPVPCNCWRECVDTWISTYDLPEKDPFSYDDNGMPVMPNYMDLP